MIGTRIAILAGGGHIPPPTRNYHEGPLSTIQNIFFVIGLVVMLATAVGCLYLWIMYLRPGKRAQDEAKRQAALESPGTRAT